MTLNEAEEQRLLHGKEYVNLPEKKPNTPDERWREMNNLSHPDSNLEILRQHKNNTQSGDHPFLSTENRDLNQFRRSKTDVDELIQDMEARNRWKVLDSQTPADDIQELNVKYRHVTDSERPQTFYKQEGRYNEERAGLYKTSYDPLKLEYSMNARERSAPQLMDTSQSHVDAVYIPTLLSQSNADALKNSRTTYHNAPGLSCDKMEAREVINTYRALKDKQKDVLQPKPTSANVRVQEGELISRESTMADSYNTKKFLQENVLDKYARNEPLVLMSNENQTLSNLRQASGKSGKSVQFSDSVTVATSNDNGVVKLERLPTRGVTPIERSYDVNIKETARLPSDKMTTTHYSSTHAMYNKENDDVNIQEPKQSSRVSVPPVIRLSQETTRDTSKDTKREWIRRPATKEPTEYRDEFSSLATNVVPKTRNSWACGSAYQSQFPTYMIDYKNDPRFSWEPGCDEPRPQTSLLRMQDRFSKTEVRRSFHNTFDEVSPDLRANVTKGKTHHFWGLNAQVLHG